MTTITFDENINLKKTHFSSIEEFQMHLMLIQTEAELTPAHKAILNERLDDADKNPDDFLSIDQLKKSITRG